MSVPSLSWGTWTWVGVCGPGSATVGCLLWVCTDIQLNLVVVALIAGNLNPNSVLRPVSCMWSHRSISITISFLGRCYDLPPLSRWGNWGTERWDHFSEVTIRTWAPVLPPDLKAYVNLTPTFHSLCADAFFEPPRLDAHVEWNAAPYPPLVSNHGQGEPANTACHSNKRPCCRPLEG